MRKYTKLSDVEVLSKSHDYFVKNTSLFNAVAIKNGLPAERAGSRKFEEFYDNSLIQELVNEDFMNKAKKSK